MVLLMGSAFSFANTSYPLPTLKQEVQFEHMLKDLRCLVCQNQNLADSSASFANDLREEVYDMVKLNKSDDEIQQAAMRAGTETLYFQLLASIIVPSLIIHTAVHKSQDAVKNVANVTLKRYGPTALGLGIIPLLPFTIDEQPWTF